MSVLKQHYIIEDHNGKETLTSDISKYVEKYGERFRFVFGTNFNIRKFSPDESRWGWSKGNYFCVAVEHKDCTFDYDRDRHSFIWRSVVAKYERKADCQFIIRDGFGRVVHPDVIYNAYLKEFGALKTKFTQQTYISSWGSVCTHGCKRRDRGKKNGCYGRIRTTINAKRLMSDYKFSKLNIDDEPAIRRSDKFDRLYRTIEWWERPYRHVERSWKQQTKAKKQWMKRA